MERILTSAASGHFLGDFGSYIVAIGLVFFAFSTLLGWSYYGEKCFNYLTNERGLVGYRVVFITLIFVGAVAQLQTVWVFADVMNGLMAFPNLIGLLGLSGIVVAETRRFSSVAKEERRKAS